jgi:hypothetical protein
MGLHVRATMTMPPHHHQIRVQKTHREGVKAPGRIDKTDLFRWQVDDAEQITEIDLMINIRKQRSME